VTARVAITGAGGFIARNLMAALDPRTDIEVVQITRATSPEELNEAVAGADVVVHLAGTNRPPDESEFMPGNAGMTQQVCDAIRRSGRRIPLLLSSSTQASRNNAYGTSKRVAEGQVIALHHDFGSPVAVYRLPGVFGKWARPNYNSVVATFCHNTVNGLPLSIHDPSAGLQLVYIDDVVADFVRRLDGDWPPDGRAEVDPVYRTTVGEVAELVRAFRATRDTLTIERVGAGFVRALYSTYISYLPPEQFSYRVPKYGDPRGMFAEVLKTPDCGQFSYFTAHPGVTRGGHYHHTKTEKFIVLRGKARFRFSHIVDGRSFELVVDGAEPEIVETVPGWAHDITNIGDSEMIVMLWANEVFDRQRPDTYASTL
jgi:UDP-2-acetamido-2,6-beta-L-arabino-hexul-4-ose reductase